VANREMSSPMLTVEDAQEMVLASAHLLSSQPVSILEALGRVLRGPILADADVPSFTSSAMDGYALRSRDTSSAIHQTPRHLEVVGEVAAGQSPTIRVTPGTAVRIMTGAPIPPGADAVVPQEVVAATDKDIAISAAVPPGQHIRPAGQDVAAGERILDTGTVLGPAHIGMLAALGHESVHVARRPRVAILATGDELVDIRDAVVPSKVRNANSYSNAAQVIKAGGDPLLLGIARDHPQDIAEKVQVGISSGADLLITSGGASVGTFDFVKEVLASQGEITFWRVRMKPGKPLVFGTIHGIPVLGLPGNPVSVMVSFEMFVRPAILQMLGVPVLHRQTIEAILVDGVANKDGRRHYLRVRLQRGQGTPHAHLTGGQGSGILSSMVKADGLAVIPEDWASVPPGSRVQVLVLN
jgi:molybdopterin molybdotransferase